MTSPNHSSRKKKRPAEAGRRAGDAISGGAEAELATQTDVSQAKSQPEPKRVAVYIDGFNLFFGLKSKGWKRYYWLDLKALSLALLKPGQRLVDAKYFTSRVSPTPADPDQGKRQSVYLEALEAHCGIRAILGHYLPKQVKCFHCGTSWQSFEEKRTDVNIAVEMLVDAQADLFDVALLISADSDLSAPIEQIRRLHPAKRIIVAFPPDRRSGNLSRLAHGSFTIGEAKLRQSQLPHTVVKPGGFALRRPTRWA